jgi:hypothetical protein
MEILALKGPWQIRIINFKYSLETLFKRKLL